MRAAGGQALVSPSPCAPQGQRPGSGAGGVLDQSRGRAALRGRRLDQIGHVRHGPGPGSFNEPSGAGCLWRGRRRPSGRSEHRPAGHGPCAVPLAARAGEHRADGDHPVGRVQRRRLCGLLLGGARAGDGNEHTGRSADDQDGHTQRVDQRAGDRSARHSSAARAVAADDDRAGGQLDRRCRHDRPGRDQSRTDEPRSGPDSGQHGFGRAVHRFLARDDADRLPSRCGTHAAADSAAVCGLRPPGVRDQQCGPDRRRPCGPRPRPRLLPAGVVPGQLAGNGDIAADQGRRHSRVRPLQTGAPDRGVGICLLGQPARRPDSPDMCPHWQFGCRRGSAAVRFPVGAWPPMCCPGSCCWPRCGSSTRSRTTT